MEFFLWNSARGWVRLAGALVILLIITAVPVRAQQNIDELIARGEAAGADARLLQTVDQRALERGMDATARAELLEMAVDLAERELPAEAILQKVLEGLAKQIPQQRLASVLSRMQQQTVAAGDIVDGWMQRPETRRALAEAQTEDPRGRRVLIENTAEALTQNVPRPTIERLMERIPATARQGNLSAAEVGAAVSVLANLPSGGQAPDAAIGLLVSALNAGYSEAEIRRLPLAIRAAEERGVPTAEATNRAVRAMERGTPAEAVLRSLFGGELPGPASGVGAGSAEGGPPSSVGPPPGIGPDNVGADQGVGNPGGRGRDN